MGTFNKLKITKTLRNLILLSAILFLAAETTFVVYANVNPEWDKDLNTLLQDKQSTEAKTIKTKEKNIQAKVNNEIMIRLYSEINTLSEDSELPGFIQLNEAELQINPTLTDLGSYDFTLISQDDNASFTYVFHVLVDLPTVDFTELENEITKILGDQEGKYAIYVYDLKRGQGFGINEEEIFYPGSTSKLPYAIITLKDVDSGKYLLSYVDFKLNSLIIHGSNTAMMDLEGMLGGNSVYNERVKNELGVDNIFRYPHVVQASDLGRLYIGIYHQEYLSESLNNYLLNLLLNTGPNYDNRIKQGLPVERGVTFAHKTGWVTTTGGGEAYNDSGIVYGEMTDYVIVVLDKNINKNDAIAMMKPISETVYDALNPVE